MRIGCIVNLQKDVEASFSEALELGLKAGQLTVWDMSLYTDDTVERVKQVCAKTGFVITAVWCGWCGPVVWGYPDMYNTLGLVPAYLRGQRTQDLLAGGRFAAALGVRDVVTHIGFFPDNPFDRDHVEIVQCLRLICGELKSRGQRFLFETGEELPVTLLALIDEVGTGNLGVNYDPANLMMNGRANSLDALRMFRSCLWGVHAKDGFYPKPGQRKGVQAPLGEGETQFSEIMKLLKEFGYNGDITIEREIPDAEQRKKDIRSAVALLNKWMREE